MMGGAGFGRMLVAVSGPAQSGEGRSCSRWPLTESDPVALLSGTTGRGAGAPSSGGGADRAGQSAVPAARSDPPRLQAVGAGQRGGGEEDFSSQLNLLENLACSPSS